MIFKVCGLSKFVWGCFIHAEIHQIKREVTF